MRKYRLYRLDGAGNISSADWIDAPGDDEAVDEIRARKLRVASEIWSGNRRVARIEPGASDDS